MVAKEKKILVRTLTNLREEPNSHKFNTCNCFENTLCFARITAVWKLAKIYCQNLMGISKVAKYFLHRTVCQIPIVYCCERTISLLWRLICYTERFKCWNIVVFSAKTDVSHLPNQSMVAISVMKLFVCLCWGLTSQSTIFQSCRDGATASWVINQYFRGVKCLAQGHNTAAVGFEPPTSCSGVRHSTTEPPCSPVMKLWPWK